MIFPYNSVSSSLRIMHNFYKYAVRSPQSISSTIKKRTGVSPLQKPINPLTELEYRLRSEYAFPHSRERV